MSLFNPTRDQVRTFFIDAWRKEREGVPQTPLEMQASTFVKWHPEYHALLEAPDALTREWTPADGETNPFLHLSMHLAVYEQLHDSISHRSLRDAFTKLCDKHGNQHDAFPRRARLSWRNGVEVTTRRPACRQTVRPMSNACA